MSINTSKIHIYNFLLKVLPPSRCNNFKVSLLRWAGARVGSNVSLFSPKILGNFDLIIGDNVWIGHEALLFGAAGSTIKIDDNAKVASQAVLVTGYHEYSIEYPNIAGPGKWDDIYIGKGSLVDTRAMILPGKSVGEKAHVAAGSIVTHDVPAFTRVAGIPARVIKNFKEEGE